jgi:hypothetical protein
MRVHLDVLGWLHALGGAIGVLAGGSLLVLATGTFLAHGALAGPSAASVIWTLGVCGLVLIAGGAGMIGAGRAVLARRPRGRPAALWLGLLNLVVIPFGTALGIYTFWALLNDDARLEFGRRPRAPQDADIQSSS